MTHTRREFLKYAGVGALAFGVPMLLKVGEAQAAITRGVGPTYIELLSQITNTGSLVGTTIGRSLIAVVFWYDPSVVITPVISVSGESNMTPIAGSKFANAAGNSAAGQIYYLANNTAGGTKTITVDLGTFGYADVVVMEYAGLDTSSQPDNSAFNDVGAPGDPTVNLTTTTANSLIVGAYIANSNFTVTEGSGYTLFGGSGFGVNIGFAKAEDNLNAGAAGAKTVNFSGFADVWAMTTASFKAAAGGATAPIRHRVTNQ